MRANEESKLQQACVKWFQLAYPQQWKDRLLFAIPNGGKRGKITAANMKREGQRPGVADMFLSVTAGGQSPISNEYLHPGLYIEFKTDKGRQSEAQKEFEVAVKRQGYKYEIVRSLEEFMEVVHSYMADA